MMSNTCLKFNVCIFSGCNQSEMNKFGLFRIWFSDNDNELFGRNFGLFNVNVSINWVKIRFLLIIFGNFIILENKECQLVERGNKIKSKVLFLV